MKLIKAILVYKDSKKMGWFIVGLARLGGQSFIVPHCT